MLEQAYSPPPEEGWTRHQENAAKPQLMERTGWSLTNHVAECILETSLVSDHPVCAKIRWLRDFFIDRAASPPHEEGNAPARPIRSHLHRPPLQFAEVSEMQLSPKT